MPLTQTEAFIADKSTQKSGQVGEQDVGGLFDRGRDALQPRDSQGVQELFEKVIAKDPKRRGAHLNLGIAIMTLNRPNEALAEFHKEQEISPNDPQSFQLAAAAAGFTGNNDEAAAELPKLSVDPRNAGAATTLGGVLSEQGKYPEAVEVLEAAVKATPDSPGLQFQLGTAHLQAGHSVQAVSHLQKAAEQNDSDPLMLNNVAYTLAEHDTDLNLARQYAEKALKEIEDRSIHYLRASETGCRRYLPTVPDLGHRWLGLLSERGYESLEGLCALRLAARAGRRRWRAPGRDL